MKLATFSDDAGTRIGIVTDGSLIDLSSAASALPRDMIGFLFGGDEALAAARKAAGKVAASILLDAVQLEAPLPRPGKFLVTNANYRPKKNAPVERDETEVT